MQIAETWLTGLALSAGAQLAEVSVELLDSYHSITVSCAARVRTKGERLLMQRLAEEIDSLFEVAFPSRNGTFCWFLSPMLFSCGTKGSRSRTGSWLRASTVWRASSLP